MPLVKYLLVEDDNMLKSFLFVPAKEKTLMKIPTLSADGIIIDLEDSIEEIDKENALNRICLFLKENSRLKNIFVRLNSMNYNNEVEKLREFKEIGFVLPKFECSDSYSSCESIWKEHTVMALIETPLGILNSRDIAACSWVDYLAFGAEDYSASTNMNNDNKFLYYQKSHIVTCAKAFKKKVIDTPCFSITDESIFRDDVNNAVAMGFDGKMLIHPKHIEYINEAFSVADLTYIKDIVSQYDKQNQAVAVIDGKIYEKMHIVRMKKIIKENGGN